MKAFLSGDNHVEADDRESAGSFLICFQTEKQTLGNLSTTLQMKREKVA
jgi:hypothetical protein